MRSHTPNCVYIIGGSGFIGNHLVSRLIGNNKVSIKIIDKYPSNSYPDLVTLADVRSAEELENVIGESSVIVNLAAEHRDDVRPIHLYREVNVAGAKNICNAARSKNIRKIIFTSTVAVYGHAPIGTDESGAIDPYNEYGRTKYEAEEIFKSWQNEDSKERTLVIIRPTVVFGENNRGNVFNLMQKISSRKFIMIGNGENRKSMAYVGNLVAFIEHSLDFGPGIHIYNYVDKPDFTINSLVTHIGRTLKYFPQTRLRVPFILGFTIGKIFDLVSFFTKKSFSISAIRVKKFCSNSVFNTTAGQTGFVPPVCIEKALAQTIQYEFIDRNGTK